MTREVMNERDCNGATNDGVDPKPPSSPKYRTSDCRTEDCPQLR